MKSIAAKMVKRLARHQAGFTLVELLVVVGIIVALAAAVIPNVTTFADRGATGSKAAEQDSVQVSMDAMMADRGITGVTAQENPAVSVSDFTSLPTQGALGLYLRKNPTKYFYCWDDKGLITAQHETSSTCP